MQPGSDGVGSSKTQRGEMNEATDGEKRREIEKERNGVENGKEQVKVPFLAKANFREEN